MQSRIISVLTVSVFLAACGGGNNTESSSEVSTSQSLSSALSSSSEASSSVDTSSSSSSSPAAQARCSDDLADQNRATARAALDEFFIQKDFSAVDRYWADPYLQHNPAGTSGVQAFKNVFQSILPSMNYQIIRVFAECDLAIVQGRYVGFSGVVFDMFRMENGKFIEHWDSGPNQASDASGPTEISDPDATHVNREIINGFYDDYLLENDLSGIESVIRSDAVIHRNGASGPNGFRSYVSGASIQYVREHYVIADGDFVFVLSEARLNGQTYALYDLYRLEDGMIVEHWDSRLRDQATNSGLGIF